MIDLREKNIFKTIALYSVIFLPLIFISIYVSFTKGSSFSASNEELSDFTGSIPYDTSFIDEYNVINGASATSNDYVTCNSGKCKLKKIPKNQNQSTSNLCWAFASLNSLEASLLNHFSDYGFTTSNTKFNQPHMGYSSYYRFKNSVNNEFGILRALKNGGTEYEIMRYLTNGMGPTQSTNFTIDDYKNQRLFTKSEIMGVEKKYRVTEIQYLSGANLSNQEAVLNKVNKIKNLLRQGYGVDITSRSLADRCLCYSTTYRSSYCPDANKTYNNNSVTGTCNYHGTAIIGWDDNFSNYKIASGDPTPPKGAWIVRNSTSSDSEYYISWYDVSTIYQNISITGIKKGLGYDNLYQYYPYMIHSSVYNGDSKNKVASIYQKKSNGKNEKLNSVSFFAKCADTFNIYFTDDIIAIIEGAANYSHIFKDENKIGSVTTSGRGFYTLSLGSSKTISNTAFIVGVSSSNNNCIVQVEKNSTNEPSSELDIAAGRSYQVDSGVWKDLNSYSTKKSNFINAYTSNTSTSSPARVKVTSISLGGGNNVNVGSTLQLSATVNPSNASNKLLAWKSSNTSVATVNNNGKVTGVKKGTATISAYATDGSGKSASISITVKEASSEVPVTGITLDHTTANIKVGAILQLSATVTPSNATNSTVTWTTSNSSVATVNSSGKVTGVSVGNATITAKAGNKTATCNVTVKSNVIEITSVSVSPTSANLEVGNQITIVTTINPVNATINSMSWTSSNSNVATINSQGVVNAINNGSATMTLKINDIVRKTVNITVQNRVINVTGVSVNPSSVSLKVGENTTLSAIVVPSNATNKTVTWTTSNNSVATVNSSGKVTAVSKGTAIITVRTADGGKTAKCNVLVEDDTIVLTDLIVSPTSLNMEVSDQQRISISPVPSGATINSLSITSSNSSVATVSNTGIVKAIKEGSATITITVNGNVRKTVSVTVKNKVVNVTGVTVTPNILNLKEGETGGVAAIVTPSNATNKTVTWSSSNTNVATVDSTGRINAIKTGSATITATTNDGGKKATCKVNVSKEVIRTTYTIEHYKEDLNGKYPTTPNEKETLSGNVGTQITPTPKNYNGFNIPNAKTIVLSENSNNIIKYYYSRKSYNISLVKADGISKVYGSGIYKYGSRVTIKADVLENYKFKNWRVENRVITSNTYTFEVVSDQEYTATAMFIDVHPSITLNKTELSLNKNNTYVLKAKVIGDNKELIWSTDKSNIVSVENGKVKALSLGTAIVTATISGTNITSSCIVKVINNNEKSIAFSSLNYDIAIGEEKELEIVTTPTNMTINSIKYTISDNSIISINNKKVKGLKLGSTKVTVKVNNKYTATTTVNVIEKPFMVDIIGYDLAFNEKTYNYVLRLSDEVDSLEIESNKGIEIIGNEGLVHNSVVTIIDIKTQKEYEIKIKKSTISVIKNLDKKELITYIVAIVVIIILLISSIRIVIKNKKNKHFIK